MDRDVALKMANSLTALKNALTIIATNTDPSEDNRSVEDPQRSAPAEAPEEEPESPVEEPKTRTKK